MKNEVFVMHMNHFATRNYLLYEGKAEVLCDAYKPTLITHLNLAYIYVFAMCYLLY